MKIKKLIMVAFIGVFSSINVNAQNGELLFKQCAACHSIGGGRLVGPDLAGVLDRRTEDEIIRFVQNPADFDVVKMAPQGLNPDEIKDILEYIVANSPKVKENETVVVQKEKVEEEVIITEDDIVLGEQLFEGTLSFENGGPSCITCHNVDYEHMMQGGLLAKDLSKVYSRSGGMNGIKGILVGLPFPAMKSSYGNHPLNDQEIVQLQAFLKHTDENYIYQHHGDKKMFLFYFALTGFLTVITIIYFMWFDRKTKGVKEDIYKRQTKSI
jgi:mono/diheme cytochrome c family protein